MLGNLEGRDNKGNGVLHKRMNHNGHENDAGPQKKTNKNGQGQGEYEGGSTTYKGKPFTKFSFNEDDHRIRKKIVPHFVTKISFHMLHS